MDYIIKFNPDTTYTPKEGDKLYDIHQKAIKGEKLTDSEKKYITHAIISSSYHGTTTRLLCWEFDFSPILHKILVLFTYGSYEVFYGINKTYLRNELGSGVRAMTYIDCDCKVKKPYD